MKKLIHLSIGSRFKFPNGNVLYVIISFNNSYTTAYYRKYNPPFSNYKGRVYEANVLVDVIPY